MSKFKSDRILDIYKKYSFCLPTGFNGTIEDLDGAISKNDKSNNARNGNTKNGSNNNAYLNITEMSSSNSDKLTDDEVITARNGFVQDSSLTIFIPFSRKNINQTNIKKNKESKNVNSQIIVVSTQSISSPSIESKPEIEPNPKPPEESMINSTNQNQPKQQQNSTSLNPYPIN